MNTRFRIALGCTLLLLAGKHTACAETTWPIQPVNVDHPIGNTLGEFIQSANGIYQHEGIDVLGDSYDKRPDAPFVVVTVGGWLESVMMNPDSRDNYVLISGEDGKHRYMYAHLEYTSIPIPIILHVNNTPSSAGATQDELLDRAESWPKLNKGDKLAKLSNLFPCDFDHVHYAVERVKNDSSITLLNPLLEIKPAPDSTLPEIAEIHLAQHNGNSRTEIPKNPDPAKCTEVQGKVDIIAEVMDRDDAGSTLMGADNVGLHSLRWRACKTASCNWKSIQVFDEMEAELAIPNNTETLAHFSTKDPWKSTFNFCDGRPGNRTFMVPSSLAAGDTWNTNNGEFPNDEYEVTVQARDIAGNKAAKSIKVCVEN